MTSIEPHVTVRSDFQERVMINTADAADVAKLYGIDPVLAARIVAFRSQNGPFHGPADLALVDGLSTDLAYVLTPHIDWRYEFVPGDEVDRSIFALSVCIIGFALSIGLLTAFVYAFMADAHGQTWSWDKAWFGVSVIILLAFATISIGLGCGAAITRSRRQRGIFIQLMIWPALAILIVLAAVVTLISVREPGVWNLFRSLDFLVTVFPWILVPAGLSIFVLMGV